MGITGLLPLLKSVTHKVHISQYRGKRVAIDGYAWLHKSIYSCSIQLATSGESTEWIAFCMRLVDKLLEFDIQVIMVFDGDELPAKKGTESIRALKRKENLSDGVKCLKRGDNTMAHTLLSRAIDITPRMAAQLIKTLKEHRPNVQCVVAPYEADAQLAFLSQIKVIDCVISEDSDTIPFGCQEILFKLQPTGYCESITLVDVYHKPIDGFDMREFNEDMTITMCIAAGCDYLVSD